MLIHLFCEGHGVHVINAMNDLLNLNKADISLVRYFVVELLNLCQSPYSEDFMNAFEPLVSNSDIQNGVNMGRDMEAMREFLGNYFFLFPVFLVIIDFFIFQITARITWYHPGQIERCLL